MLFRLAAKVFLLLYSKCGGWLLMKSAFVVMLIYRVKGKEQGQVLSKARLRR